MPYTRFDYSSKELLRCLRDFKRLAKSKKSPSFLGQEGLFNTNRQKRGGGLLITRLRRVQ